MEVFLRKLAAKYDFNVFQRNLQRDLQKSEQLNVITVRNNKFWSFLF